MIYFDNGATSMPKPESVALAAAAAVRSCSNPGRGGHKPSMLAGEVVLSAREEIAGLFNLSNPENVIFTSNCTMSLNMAIKGLLRGGNHAVISGYEHNSVVRPLEKLRTRGVSYTAATSPLFDSKAAVNAINRAITPYTKCVIVTHVSNVFGFVMPILEIDKLCYEKNIMLIIDAAQSAGCIDIDVSKFKALAFVCMPGHKALLGPQGTGVLLCCRNDIRLDTTLEGGTGSVSQNLVQPDFLPDRYESGTLNVPGIAGLLEGVRFVRKNGAGVIGAYEREMVSYIADGLRNISRVEVFNSGKRTESAGVLSFRTELVSPEELAAKYSERGICVRAGLHCAPLAHKTVGTLETGTVRITPSWFSTTAQANRFLADTADILTQYR